jgi:hypothetical protein
MLLLYKSLIGSVLDYALLCYFGMAGTHMLRLERVQYRSIRLALGPMCSTPNNSLGVLSDIPPLPERFVYLNSRYLVAVFYRQGHPWHSVGRYAYEKCTGWGSGYNVPASGAQGALKCDIGIC